MAPLSDIEDAKTGSSLAPGDLNKRSIFRALLDTKNVTRPESSLSYELRDLRLQRGC